MKKYGCPALYMKKILVYLPVMLFLLFIRSSVTSAQTPAVNLESCFDYYDYGKIQAYLTADQESYASGGKVTISGTIVNNNTFPLADVVLYAQLRRVNETETFTQNGHFLIDRLTLAENLNFLPKETKSINVTLPILSTYPDGTYQLQYFLFSENEFHYGGRPFLEEDTAGYSTFNIASGVKPEVYFDIDSLQVNGTAYPIRGITSEFDQDPITFKVNLIDNRKDKNEIPVEVKWYKFTDSSEEELISTSQIEVSKEKGFVQTSFTPPYPGAFVLYLEIKSPVRSLFKYRFAKKGNAPSTLRMNDLGVTDYPASEGSKAYVCFHSPTYNSTKETKINLSILDKAKQEVGSTSYTGKIDGDIHAISMPLLPLKGANDFWVKGVFINTEDNKIIRTVETHYTCSKFSGSLADIRLLYTPSSSNAVSIEAADGCGAKMSQGGYIESIRITKGGVIKKELYNVDASVDKISLDGLPAGTYQAEVKSGKLSRVMDITISSQAKKASQEQNLPSLIPKIVLTIGFALMIGALIFIWKKYRITKESQKYLNE